MDPPLVGSHCSREDCHNHDFLPTKCHACEKLYCTDHYFPDNHDCVASASTSTDAPNIKINVLPCAHEGCSSPCLESYVARDVGEDARIPATCPHCSLSYCSQHRFPEAHNCKPPTAQPARNEAAKALLAKNFPAHDMTKKGSISISNSSLAPTKKRQKSQGSRLVQLMKMRQSAIPGDPKTGHVDVQDRLYIQAKLNQSDIYKTFWFRKSISAGRAFDLLQQRLDASSAKSWTLLKEFDEEDKSPAVLATFDKQLSDELEDGCKVILKPIELQ